MSLLLSCHWMLLFLLRQYKSLERLERSFEVLAENPRDAIDAMAGLLLCLLFLLLPLLLLLALWFLFGRTRETDDEQIG